MRLLNAALAGWLVIFFTGGLLSCAVNPVTGRQELMLLSESDEVNLGLNTDAKVIKQHGIYEDSKLITYLNDIYLRIAKVSHRPNLTYHLKILDASAVNAFALPGGYVYLTRGILATLNSEAELAAVMGHEIGHITARHSAQLYSKRQLAQVGLLGLGMAFPEAYSSFAEVAQIGVGMLFLRFSRDNERQADELGVEYASKVGYDASQLANFFENLERINPGSDRSGLPGWFSTHPSPANRVSTIRALANQWQGRLGRRDWRVHQEDFLRQIDGLVFGEDPRQGYVEGNVFYHPELRFQFPVPADWKINHTPSAVQMVSQGQEAVMLFTMATGVSSSEVSVAFTTRTGVRVIQAEAIQINGMNAERVLSEIQTQKGVLRVVSYFIERGNRTFLFHGLTSSGLFNRYASVFERTMRQFRGLSDPTKIHVKPDRIRIHNTQTSDTLEHSLRMAGVPEDRLAETAFLNGRYLKDQVPANTLLKIVKK